MGNVSPRLLAHLHASGGPLAIAERDAELRDTVHDGSDGMSGWLHRLSLTDVLQMYHHAGGSLAIHVRGDLEGAIAMRHGELVHAECRDRTGATALTGMPALVELLSLSRGQLETAALESDARTLSGPFDHVLLDCLRSLDEAHRQGGPVSVVAAPPGGWPGSWLDELPAGGALDHHALRGWLGEHAPGAAAWQIDPAAATVDRIDRADRADAMDASGAAAELAILDAQPPGALAWAYELAELADPSWRRVELTTGDLAIAVLRVSGVVVGFARRVSGDAMLHRFQLESVRLLRWLTDRMATP